MGCIISQKKQPKGKKISSELVNFCFDIFLWKKMVAIISNVTFSYTFIQSTEVVLCRSLGASIPSPIFPQKPLRCPFSELCHMPVPTPSTEKGTGLQWFLYSNRYFIYPQTLVTWESTRLQGGRKSKKYGEGEHLECLFPVGKIND